MLFSHITLCYSNNFIIFASKMKGKIRNRRRKHLGLLLQHERKCKKLEQEDIARALGARQEYISKIETGTRRIDILELIDYCEALDFSLTDFAWKIETYLSALDLLSLPKRNLLGKKFRVEVSWRENKFSASLRDIVPETLVFTAETFMGLQKEIEKWFDSVIKVMASDGKSVPCWLENKEYTYEYKFLDATSLLNAYSPYVSLAAISRVSGINQNQLSQYANGFKKARPDQVKRILEAIRKIGNDLTAAVL